MTYYPLPQKSTQAHAIIIANGEFPIHEIPLSILKSQNPIVCCDGALTSLLQIGIVPTVIVGDCDSLSAADKQKYAAIICEVSNQDTNDLTKALHYCQQQGWGKLIILGATGKREDHTIANISLLADYIDLVTQVSMISNYGIFNAINADACFQSFSGQQVSIFSMAPAPITSKHLKYPINQQIFTSWWQASLNESLGDEFILQVNNKTIVYRSFIDGKLSE